MAKETRMIDDSQSVPPATHASERLVSLDALRGFDMFCIIGGDQLVRQAAKLNDWPWLDWMSEQAHHPEWHGFTFYDLIFPLFLFLAGVSMPFSFEKRLGRGETKGQLYRHVLIRCLTLVVLGLILNGLLKLDFQNMRYPHVLARIGLAYAFAAVIMLNTNWCGQLLWIAGLLVGYWAALKFIPVPEFGAGDLAPGHTLTDYLDRLLLPGKLYKEVRDPEGILSTVPAIATALSGALAGQLLKKPDVTGAMKSLLLALAGVACLAAAWMWNHEFPINKNLWSSSFVLHCSGWSLLLLATFYLVIDVWKLRSWAFFFVVIGSNSILIYVAQRVFDLGHTRDYLFGGVLSLTGDWQPMLSVVAYIVVEWLLLYLLYRNRIFLRV
ncbi:acyltransferase family protein [Adhaeretor mobilis]|uniref:Uncharacterized protein n=1 Tax=Adhaeretor mobilis TaxID=1930276 RepID=A0A517MZG6_9BACT|nr:DUF5009 domain-containing protein [Adhaeretor mobilis]QDT00280.1 hypothetical protein HG15A2_36160 [Adhaeretor mobilis]